MSAISWNFLHQNLESKMADDDDNNNKVYLYDHINCYNIASKES